MTLIKNIAYIMAALGGLYILLLEYGILPNKSDKKEYKSRRVMKIAGFALLIYSILRLVQIWF